MNPECEIVATFREELHRFGSDTGDTIIVRMTRRESDRRNGDQEPLDFKAKGRVESCEDLQKGMAYLLLGRWADYKSKSAYAKSRQFHFSSIAESKPYTRDGVIEYLAKLGEGLGIGRGRAGKLWSLFGADAIDKIKQTPEQAASAISGWSVEDAKGLALLLKDRERLEASTIELNELLSGRGFPKATAMSAIKEWGVDAPNKVRENPYLLMSFRGCGFKLTDKLYLSLGLDPLALQRQALCAWYGLASDTNGHTWFPRAMAEQRVIGQIGHGARPAEAIEEAQRIGRLSLDSIGSVDVLNFGPRGEILTTATGVGMVAEGRKSWCEQQIARSIVAATAENFGGCWPDVDGVEGIDAHQREELRKAFAAGPVAILGGSPGTGKTYTAAKVIANLARVIGNEQIAIAAPTGKAAVRITETMRSHGLNLSARTWHSTLGINTDSFAGGWSFQRNESNPLPHKVLIGDETSMVDAGLMSAILRARSPGTRILFVGDVNQLPPVGHGAPLRDMIDAGLPYGELREIKRNSGGIVEACAAIRDGDRWESGDNLIHHAVSGHASQIKRMLDSIAEHKRAGINPIWGCQVLVTVNEKSPLSRKEINSILQRELNPNEIVKGGFAVGDKVVNGKNRSFSRVDIAWRNGRSITSSMGHDYPVANGELGRVVDFDESLQSMLVEVEGTDVVVRVYLGRGSDDDSDDNSGGCTWQLGYALTVHKSQGSQWPVVLVLLDEYPGAKIVACREHIYTAISRAEKQCELIGPRQVADAACAKSSIKERRTALVQRIKFVRAEMEAATL